MPTDGEFDEADGGYIGQIYYSDRKEVRIHDGEATA
jgi:hypothetical protein